METIRIFIASSSELLQDRKDFRDFLSIENDWLDKQENIYKLTGKDLEDLGIDFIDLDG